MSFLGDIRVVRGYLAVGLAAVVSYRWVHGDPAYWGIALYGLAGVVVGALRMPRAQRRPWLALATGIGFWVIGDIEWEVEAMLGRNPQSPDASDIL